MPKIKSNKGAAKRFRTTGKGKIKMKRAGFKHNLRKRGQKTKRELRLGGYVDGSDFKRIQKLIPYS